MWANETYSELHKEKWFRGKSWTLEKIRVIKFKSSEFWGLKEKNDHFGKLVKSVGQYPYVFFVPIRKGTPRGWLVGGFMTLQADGAFVWIFYKSISSSEQSSPVPENMAWQEQYRLIRSSQFLLVRALGWP